MKVQCILREAELNEAIRAYIIKEGYPVEGMEIQINLIKGRTAGNTRAEVDLVPQGEVVETPQVVDSIEEIIEDAIEDVTETVEDIVENVSEAIESVKDSLFSKDDEEEETEEEDEDSKPESLFR